MQKKIFIILFFLFLVVVFFLLFLLPKKQVLYQNNVSRQPLSLSVSLYPVAYLVEKVAGSLANVHLLTPPGVEPHDYEPSPSDIAKLYEGDAVILNGGGMDPWGEKIQNDLRAKKIPVFIFADELKNDAIVLQELSVNGSTKENMDPHMWLSPKLYAKQAILVADFLSSLDPSHKDDYEKNAVALEKELLNLDADFSAGLKTCEGREIIVSHDAFSYFGSEYGIAIYSITGLSAEGEASPAWLMNLLDLIKTRKINTIFFETLVSPKLAQTLANEAGVETAVLNPIEGLTKTDIQNHKNYDILMRENLLALKKALVCQ